MARPAHPLEDRIVSHVLSQLKEDSANEYRVVTTCSNEIQSVYLTYATERMVENGGFEHFLQIQLGECAYEALEGFKAIGGEECVRCLSKVLEVFLSEYPDQTLFLHDGSWKGLGLGENDPNPFDELDELFYSAMEKDNTTKCRAEYIKSNEAALRKALGIA